MEHTAIFPGRYVQAEGALDQLGEEIERLGNKALAIAGGTASGSLVPPLLPNWRERIEVSVERFGGECSDGEIQRLTRLAQSRDCDVVVALGGGSPFASGAQTVWERAAQPCHELCPGRRTGLFCRT